jgi:hypothetical protein
MILRVIQICIRDGDEKVLILNNYETLGLRPSSIIINTGTPAKYVAIAAPLLVE